MFRYSHCGWNRRYAFATGRSYADRADSQAEGSQENDHRRGGYYSRAHGGKRRGGSFGARRPLRYLSYHLDLDEDQQRHFAAVLDRLKMEQAQAELDEKKTTSELAGLIIGESVSVDDLRQALSPRVDSARNLQTAIASALQELASKLDADQRGEFAYLLRTGAFRL